MNNITYQELIDKQITIDGYTLEIVRYGTDVVVSDKNGVDVFTIATMIEAPLPNVVNYSDLVPENVLTRYTKLFEYINKLISVYDNTYARI